MASLGIISEPASESDGLYPDVFSAIAISGNMEWPEFATRETYSPECVAETIAEALRKNNGELMKTIIHRAAGIENPQVDRVDMSLVIYGQQNTIIKITCIVRQSGQIPMEVSLVAIVAVDAGKNGMTYGDAEKLKLLRQRESAVLRMEEDSDQYEKLATFPPVYGMAQSGRGPFFFLTKYYKNTGGFYVSAQYQGDEDILGGEVKRVNVIASRDAAIEAKSRIMLSIIQHQLIIATKCHVVLSPSFEAGDYIVDFREGKYLLTTTRENTRFRNNFWAFLASGILDEDEDSTETYMALQLLQLVTAKTENGAGEEAECKPTRHPFFTYDINDIGYMLGSLIKMSGFMSKEQWGKVLEYVDQAKAGKAGVIIEGEGDNLDRAEFNRMEEISSGIQFYLSQREENL